MAADARRNTPEPGCHGSGSDDTGAGRGTREFDMLLELDHGINLLSDDSLINNLHVMSLTTTRDFLISSQMLRTQEFCSSSGKILGKRTKILKYSHVND